VNSNTYRARGCAGTIVVGCFRHLEETRDADFTALARRKYVGYAFSCPIPRGAEVKGVGD
jgi:regulator of RNase E activity RraA